MKWVGAFILGCLAVSSYGQHKDSLTLPAKQLQELILRSRSASYLSDSSSTATRFQLPLSDIPQSIQIINASLLKDQQALSIAEAVKSFAGVNVFGSVQVMDYAMRGFRAGPGNFAVDGIRLNDYYNNSGLQLPSYNIDRLEFLKGPAAAIFGSGNPGGLINIVTKKPMAENRAELDLTVGSFRQYRFMGDITGPLSQNKKWRYRLVAGYENTGMLEKGQWSRDVYISPQLEYHFTDRTMLQYCLEVDRDSRSAGGLGVPLLYFPATNTWQLDRYPVDLTLASTRGKASFDKLINRLHFTHAFSPALTFTTLFLLLDFRQRQFGLDLNNVYLGAVNDSIPLSPEVTAVHQFSLQSSSFLSLKARIGPITHDIVAGIDLSYQNQDFLNGQGDPMSVSVLHPALDWGFSTYDAAYTALAPQSFHLKGKTKEAGAYFNDLLSLGAHWKLLIGGRFTESTGKVGFYDLFQGKDSVHAHAFIPRAGIVYKPSGMVSFYASYIRGFLPEPLSYSAQGGPYPPEESTQYETGVKMQSKKADLIVSVAAYHIQKFNVLVTRPSNNNLDSLIANVKSKGIECTIQGAPFQDINLIANYSLNVTRTPGDNGYDGNPPGQFPDAPKYTFNAWIKYNPQKIGSGHLGLALGMVHISERTTFTPVTLPGYTTLDAAVMVRVQKIRIALNVYNLTNTRYWTGGTPPSLYPGNPLSFRVNLNYVF